MGSTRINENRRLVSGHQWGVQLQREVEVLVTAMKGVGLPSIFLALATEAVIADNGTLTDSSGEPGYAWTPKVYETKSPGDPITARIRAAGASLGRVLAGGHPTYRAYLAFLEALYVVTTQQEYDVAERIEKLWDEAARLHDTDEEHDDDLVADRRPRGWVGRLWSYLRLHWLGY